jgi:hypothetical protein
VSGERLVGNTALQLSNQRQTVSNTVHQITAGLHRTHLCWHSNNKLQQRSVKVVHFAQSLSVELVSRGLCMKQQSTHLTADVSRNMWRHPLSR